jgi:hypothetical protein
MNKGLRPVKAFPVFGCPLSPSFAHGFLSEIIVTGNTTTPQPPPSAACAKSEISLQNLLIIVANGFSWREITPLGTLLFF